MPWFRRPSAMSKHCGIFIDNAIEMGIEPIIASFKGSAHSDGYNVIDITDKSNKYVAAAMRRIFPDVVNLPDVYNWGTRKSAVKEIISKVNMSAIDVIHSVSFPCTSHLIASDLAKHFSKPWMAQFYDPWSDNPYRKFKTNIYRKRDLELEGFVAINADTIIHTNDYIKQEWEKRYGDEVAKKMYVLPMSYEDDLYAKAEKITSKEPDKKIIISYIGKLFFDRNLKDTVEALTLLKKKGIDVATQFKFRIIGEIRQTDINRINDAGLKDAFEIAGYLPQSELERYYIESDAFLVLDSPQVENVFFPSKLLDYFIYKRMIIGITPRKGVTYDLLVGSKNVVFENGDVEGLADYLQKLILDKSLLKGFDGEFYKFFSPEALRSKYQMVMERLKR